MRTTIIQRQREGIEADIASLHEELKALQKKCKHRKVVKVPHADTGNWDKSDDRYWYTFDCPECGKHWTEDQ
jgi:hypothetical protein